MQEEVQFQGSREGQEGDEEPPEKDRRNEDKEGNTACAMCCWQEARKQLLYSFTNRPGKRPSGLPQSGTTG